MQEIINTIPNPVTIINKKQEIIFVNKATTELYGENWKNKKCSQYFKCNEGKNCDENRCLIDSVLNEKKSFKTEYGKYVNYKDKRDRDCYIEQTISPLKDKIGEDPGQSWPKEWDATPVLPEQYRP